LEFFATCESSFIIRRLNLTSNSSSATLAGDAEQLGDLGFGPAGGWNHILP
jgi:hypothetical protein